MYLGITHYVHQAFALPTQKPHEYLVVDLKQTTPDGMRLQSHIYPSDQQEVYVEDI